MGCTVFLSCCISLDVRERTDFLLEWRAGNRLDHCGFSGSFTLLFGSVDNSRSQTCPRGCATIWQVRACVRLVRVCVCVSTAQTTIQTQLLFDRRICEVVHPRGRGLWCVCLTDFGRHVGWAAPTLTFNGIPMWIFPLPTLCWSREGRLVVIFMCSLKFRFGTVCDSFRGRQIRIGK